MEKDYTGKTEIRWTKTPSGWHSQDLLYVMYHIKAIEVKG
jgi:hypothetical protein